MKTSKAIKTIKYKRPRMKLKRCEYADEAEIVRELSGLKRAMSTGNVYAKVRHVSSSGMSRVIDYYYIREGQLVSVAQSCLGKVLQGVDMRKLFGHWLPFAILAAAGFGYYDAFVGPNKGHELLNTPLGALLGAGMTLFALAWLWVAWKGGMD